jgi:hypothetical protein
MVFWIDRPSIVNVNERQVFRDFIFRSLAGEGGGVRRSILLKAHLFFAAALSVDW